MPTVMLILDERLRGLAPARLAGDDRQARSIDRIRLALQDPEVMDILNPKKA